MTFGKEAGAAMSCSRLRFNGGLSPKKTKIILPNLIMRRRK